MEERDLLTAMSRAIDLVEVRALHLEATHLADEPPGSVRLDAKINAPMDVSRKDKQVTVLVKFGFEARPEDVDTPFFRAAYHVVAFYRVREGEFDEPALNLFARHQVMLHLWPYFRAHLQMMAGTLGLRPLVLPPIRAGHGFPSELRGLPDRS